jgi:hypothetical protein
MVRVFRECEGREKQGVDGRFLKELQTREEAPERRKVMVKDIVSQDVAYAPGELVQGGQHRLFAALSLPLESRRAEDRSNVVNLVFPDLQVQEQSLFQ